MPNQPAPCRLLIWLAAAALGWAVVAGMVLYLPQVLAGCAVAAVLLWRTGQRAARASEPATAESVPARALEQGRPAVPALA